MHMYWGWGGGGVGGGTHYISVYGTVFACCRHVKSEMKMIEKTENNNTVSLE